MKIYFNANNKAHLEALSECGVRNVMLSFKYSYANITKFRDKFDSIFVVAGTGTEPDRYHDLLIKHKENYDYATQFDVFYNMEETMKHLKKEREMGIDWTLPVLQGNYLNHLSMLRPNKDDYLCLGEIHGKLETEDQMRKLPPLKYNGLAKGKYISKSRMFESLDTSAWISGAMSKKTEVWNAGSTTSMMFGDKGKSMIPMLRHSCEVHKEHLEKIKVKAEDVINAEYYSLLRAPLALLFMPMCKHLNIYEQNFKY